MKAIRRFAFALVLLLPAAALRGDVQKKTLLATDGTVYQISTGLASELAVPGAAGNFAVVWSAVRQDGTATSGVIPGASSSSPKTSLDLTYDDPTGTLVVLWREESSILNEIRLALLKGGAWSVANLLPNFGFPHAYNPQMLLTHETVHTVTDAGADVYSNRSVLSVIWWEEASVAQARYASIFLDETIDPTQIDVYDLPELVAASGPTSLADIPRGAYAFPSIQAEGPGGAVLANFAALSSDTNYVVRITYPTDLGVPGANNITWLRRRAPIVGIASQGPIATIPTFDTNSASVGTVIGSSYQPTLYWGDGVALHYLRFDGTAWSAVLSITLSSDLTYDQAVALVRGMAQRN